MRTGLTKQEKTTDIWFDEKDPLNSMTIVMDSGQIGVRNMRWRWFIKIFSYPTTIMWWILILKGSLIT